MNPSRNRHVWEYLEYYADLPHPPHYAVLVNGPWGIGKTYLVKKFLESHFESRGDYVYVSLYGLSSAQEIDETLLASIYPALSSKKARIAGRLVRGALKSYHIDLDLKKSDLLNRAKAELYVFDDLERCGMDISTVLGYMNEFIEQDDRKVVVIANEEEIANIESYHRRREKLIGKTLEFESVFDEALAHFVSQLDDEATRGFIGKRIEIISTIYKQSALDNLRILQQSLWDFERIFRVLSNKHRGNEVALSALLRMFLALSFEMKCGRIGADDLRNRMKQVVLARIAPPKKDQKPSSFEDAVERYPDTDLGDSVLSDELLADILLRGLVNSTDIEKSLDRSPYYAKREDEPAWRVLWHALEISDDEFERARAEVERRYSAREFTIAGEILHVLGMRLWLADLNVLSQSRADVVNDGKAYIDELRRLRRLEPLGPHEIRDDLSAGYGGLGIYQADSSEYKELFEYMSARREQAAVDRYPELAVNLLRELRTDPELYFRRLCMTNSADNIYARIPILVSIEPAQFVDLVLQQTPLAQRVIFTTFRVRYQHGQLNGELASEKAWLATVRDQLVARARSMSKVSQYRTTRFVEWYLSPFLSEP